MEQRIQLGWRHSAPADDHAEFTGTFANQPTLTGFESVGGVWITALGQDLGSDLNDNLLSISGNTVNGIPGIAVLFDNTTGFNAAINNPISIDNDNLSIRNDTDQDLSFSAFTNNANVIELNANTLTFSNSGAGTITTNVISGTGGVTINSSGTGAVISSDNSTSFSGKLTVAEGVLSISSANNASTNGRLGNSALSVDLGSSGKKGTLQYTNGSSQTTSKSFTLVAGGTGEFDITQAGTTLTVQGGLIDGSGELLKTGPGLLGLSTANTFSGGVTVEEGSIILRGSSTPNTVGSTVTKGPVGTGTLTLAGGNLRNGATSSIANNIVVAANTTNGIFGDAANLTLNGTLSGSGTIDNTLDPGNASRSVAFNGDINNFSGTIIHNRVPSASGVGTDTYRFNGTTPESHDGSQAKFVLNGSTDTSSNGTIFRIVTQSGVNVQDG